MQAAAALARLCIYASTAHSVLENVINTKILRACSFDT